jgi:uncharacterized protein YjdB
LLGQSLATSGILFTITLPSAEWETTMTTTSEERIHKLETKVSRLENIAWVLGAVALFLGIGGGSLWNNVRVAQSEIRSSVDNAKAAIVQAGDAEREQVEASRAADPGWGVAYCTHQQSRGWHRWVTGGTVSGEIGNQLRVEAIRIRLYRLDQTPPTGPCTP